MKPPRLIPEWRQAHRLASVRVLASAIVAGVVAGTTVYFNVRDAAPELVTIGLCVGVCALAILARVWQQKPRAPRDSQEA